MWKKRLVSRVACVYLFILYAITLTTLPLFAVAGFIHSVVIKGKPFEEWWRVGVVDNCANRLMPAFSILWRSFRDGELYSFEEG